MLSRSLGRYALVAVVSALVAMSFAAPAVTAHNNGFNERILACFESGNADSEECRLALEVSPVDSDFFRRLAENLDNPLPAPEPEVDLKTLVKACAASGDLESEDCVRAIEASGLSLEDFKAEYAYKLGKLAKTYPTEKTYKNEMTSTMRDCLELKKKLSGGASEELIEKINYVCRKAMVEYDMSPSQFWTKYR